MQLYTAAPSSHAFAVRIALRLKQLPHELIPVPLEADGARCQAPDYLRLNPQGLVPTLVDGRRIFTHLLPILEYLEEAYPEPALLPSQARDRARVRSLMSWGVAEIQPLLAHRTLQFLQTQGMAGADQERCIQSWLQLSLTQLEQMLHEHPTAGRFCFGDTPTLADACLIPLLYRAVNDYQRNLQGWPTLAHIYRAAMLMEPFALADPSRQPAASRA